MLQFRQFQRVLLGIGLFALTAAPALGWFLSAPISAFSESAAPDLEKPGDAGRGRVVFEAGGCASCHARPGNRIGAVSGAAWLSPRFSAPSTRRTSHQT